MAEISSAVSPVEARNDGDFRGCQPSISLRDSAEKARLALRNWLPAREPSARGCAWATEVVDSMDQVHRQAPLRSWPSPPQNSHRPHRAIDGGTSRAIGTGTQHHLRSSTSTSEPDWPTISTGSFRNWSIVAESPQFWSRFFYFSFADGKSRWRKSSTHCGCVRQSNCVDQTNWTRCSKIGTCPIFIGLTANSKPS